MFCRICHKLLGSSPKNTNSYYLCGKCTPKAISEEYQSPSGSGDGGLSRYDWYDIENEEEYIDEDRPY